MINGELVTELNEHSTYATLIFKINGETVRLDNMETKTDENNHEIITLNFKQGGQSTMIDYHYNFCSNPLNCWKGDLQLNRIIWKSLGDHMSEWYHDF